MSPAQKSNATRMFLVVLVITCALNWPRGNHPKPPARLVEVLRRELILRDGLWYRNSATNAFTGVIVESYTNGMQLSRAAVSNGLLNGWSETWYTNGQMQMREGYKDGVSDGLREKWYPNGQEMSQAVIVHGKVTGLFQRWHDNGQLAEKIQMKDGQPDGVAWAYYPSGFVQAEITEQDGRQLNRRLWKDGELKPTQ